MKRCRSSLFGRSTKSTRSRRPWRPPLGISPSSSLASIPRTAHQDSYSASNAGVRPCASCKRSLTCVFRKRRLIRFIRLASFKGEMEANHCSGDAWAIPVRERHRLSAESRTGLYFFVSLTIRCFALGFDLSEPTAARDSRPPSRSALRRS